MKWIILRGGVVPPSRAWKWGMYALLSLMLALSCGEPVEDIKAKLLLCYCVITSNSLQLFGFKTETEEKADLSIRIARLRG